MDRVEAPDDAEDREAEHVQPDNPNEHVVTPLPDLFGKGIAPRKPLGQARDDSGGQFGRFGHGSDIGSISPE
jgi:hypothetical protein